MMKAAVPLLPAAEPRCPVCRKVTGSECGLVECGNRKPLTVDLPAGVTRLDSGCYKRRVLEGGQ